MDNGLYSIGKKIERLRKMKGMNQETLADLSGMTRQTYSKMIKTEEVDEEKLAAIAKGLGVSTESIKNFDEDSVINYIQNNYDHAKSPNIFGSNNHIYSEELLMQMVQENKNLYERLLTAEREKVEILQKMIDKK